MGNILFSVLIPVFNVQKYLSECIDSVLNQTYQNFEIILIDDGSTDLSGDICDKYASQDFRVKAYHQTNQGQLISRRNAIERSVGDFCLFLDSDDYWDSDLLETINQTIFDFNCDMVIYKEKQILPDRVYVTDAIFKNKSLFDIKNKEDIFIKLISGTSLNSLCTKAVKRCIIDDFDYTQYKKMKNGEDLLQSLPLIYNAQRIVYIDRPMYNYRMNPTSITNTFNFELFTSGVTAREILLKYLKILKLDTEKNLRLFYQFYCNSILNYISKLMLTKKRLTEKRRILSQIHKLQMFNDALCYIDINSFTFFERLRLFLFKREYYRVLLFYENGIIKFLRLSKRLVKI